MIGGYFGNKGCFSLLLKQANKRTLRCTLLPIEVAIITVVAHAKGDHMEAK